MEQFRDKSENDVKFKWIFVTYFPNITLNMDLQGNESWNATEYRVWLFRSSINQTILIGCSLQWLSILLMLKKCYMISVIEF